MWERAAAALEDSLDGVTIADLAVRQEELYARLAPAYSI
jgi:DNA-binding IscR family transcriptional regulator